MFSTSTNRVWNVPAGIWRGVQRLWSDCADSRTPTNAVAQLACVKPLREPKNSVRRGITSKHARGTTTAISVGRKAVTRTAATAARKTHEFHLAPQRSCTERFAVGGNVRGTTAGFGCEELVRGVRNNGSKNEGTREPLVSAWRFCEKRTTGKQPNSRNVTEQRISVDVFLQ